AASATWPVSRRSNPWPIPGATESMNASSALCCVSVFDIRVHEQGWSQREVLMRRLIPATLFACTLFAADVPRPRIVGLTHIAVRVHDLNASRHFYGDLLGFPEIFTVDRNHKAVTKGGLPQSEVVAAFFKVNDRQYIVLVPESKPDEARFVDYALETDDAE